MMGDPVFHFHHIGYATKDIEASAALYVKRFGYEVVTPVIHDPIQTALVQFLRLPADKLYLEFVAPDGPESKLSNAMRRGGGLNHLCYTSGPLEHSVAHLEETGSLLISEPATAAAFEGRRICWLIGEDRVPVELIERKDDDDLCIPRVT